MGFPMGPEGIPSPAAKESYQTIPEGEPQRMQLRNIGIFAHVDAGKTTLSEHLRGSVSAAARSALEGGLFDE